MANGIYSNSELLDTVIVDLNNLPRKLIEGQYIQFCAIVAQMGQKIMNLRESIKADLASKDKEIEDLKQVLRNAGEPIEDLTPEEFVAEFTKDGTDKRERGNCDGED